MDSHALVSDSDAEEETRLSITHGSDLPRYLKRIRKQGPVTRKEYTYVVTRTHDVDIKMKSIYTQFGKLCTMIEDEGLEIPHGLIQDFHEHVLDPLCAKFKLLNTP